MLVFSRRNNGITVAVELQPYDRRIFLQRADIFKTDILKMLSEGCRHGCQVNVGYFAREFAENLQNHIANISRIRCQRKICQRRSSYTSIRRA